MAPSLLSLSGTSGTAGSLAPAEGMLSALPRASGSLPSGIVCNSPMRLLFDSESSDLAESCPPAGSDCGSEIVSSDILLEGTGLVVPCRGEGAICADGISLIACPVPTPRPAPPWSATRSSPEGWTCRRSRCGASPSSPPSAWPEDMAEALSGYWAGLLQASSGGTPSLSTSTAPVLWPCICLRRSLYCLDSTTCMAISSGWVAGRSWSVLHFHSLLLMATYTVCPFCRITSPGPTQRARSPPLATRHTRTHWPAVQVLYRCIGGRDASLTFSRLVYSIASFLALSLMLWLLRNSKAGVSISLGSQRISSQPGVCWLASERSSAGSLGFRP